MMPFASVESTQVDTIRALASLAYEFGPFLFTILFLMFVTNRVQKNYREVCSRKDPKPKVEEIHARRNVYYGAWVITSVLIVVSTGWWIFYKSQLAEDRAFRFSIEALGKPEVLEVMDDQLYTRIATHWSVMEVERGIYTQHFALLGGWPDKSEGGIELRYIDTVNNVEGTIVVSNEMQGKKYVIAKKGGKAAVKDGFVLLREAGKKGKTVVKFPRPDARDNVFRLVQSR